MRTPKQESSLGILTVATNIYLDYWRDLAFSIDGVTKSTDKVVLHVFTNQIEKANDIARRLTRVKVVAHSIPNFKWPEATLLRYKIFSDSAEQISEDILMHLDADMIVKRSPLNDIFTATEINSMCLVSHPGYWRPRGLVDKTRFYLNNPRMFLIDLRMLTKMGGLGSWETNQQSTAFVSRERRRNYVCGGTWFGKRVNFLELVSKLSENVAQDLQSNKIAIWHDESHLNSWAASNFHLSLDPKFCFVDGYPQLRGLDAVIMAVDKPVSTR